MKYPNIEAERARRGITRTDMVGVMDVSYATYRNIMTGKSQMPYDTARKLATYFGVPIEYLMEEARS